MDLIDRISEKIKEVGFFADFIDSDEMAEAGLRNEGCAGAILSIMYVENTFHVKLIPMQEPEHWTCKDNISKEHYDFLELLRQAI